VFDGMIGDVTRATRMDGPANTSVVAVHPLATPRNAGFSVGIDFDGTVRLVA
jgi:hypothetical protein